MRHKQFAHLRIGSTEDFVEAPDLLEHIASLSDGGVIKKPRPRRPSRTRNPVTVTKIEQAT